ncbi:hypothetical protein BOX15_Mlig020369g1, partial [Macrostomum lignano]
DKMIHTTNKLSLMFAWLFLPWLLLPLSTQAVSTPAASQCQQIGSLCNLTVCPNQDSILVPCPELSSTESIDRIEYLPLPIGSSDQCSLDDTSQALPACLSLRNLDLNEESSNLRDCYTSLKNSIRDQLKLRATGRCVLNIPLRLASACYQLGKSDDRLLRSSKDCSELASGNQLYFMNIVLSRKVAPTLPFTSSTTTATTARPRTEPPRCPTGFVFAVNESDSGVSGRCESLAVSGDACRSLALRAPTAYQRETGDCAPVPDTEAGVRLALADTRNSSVKAQVLSRFAQTREFDNATEVSGFASLLESEASTAFANASAFEMRQTVGDLLNGVTAFGSKDVWTASAESGSEDADDGRKLAEAAGAVIRTLDSLGRGLQFAGPEVNVSTSAIAMSVRRMRSGSALMQSDSAAVKVNLLNKGNSASSFSAASPPVSMVTSVVNLPRLISRLGNAGQPVASRIVQATLYSAADGARLDSGVELRVLLLLPHLDSSNVGSAERRCVFLQADSSLSERGCRPVAELSDSSRTACSCEHLTSFAAVVLPGTVWLGPDTHRLWRMHSPVLRALTYVCLGASIACLLITNITYLAIKLRGPLADKSVVTLHRVHHSLCFALLLAHSLYLVGFNPPAALGHLGCQILSGLTLYALLCVFCWLLCEGVMYAKSLIVVLPGVDSAFAKVKFWHYCLLSYAAPAVIVAITAGLRHRQLIQLESPDLASDSATPAPKACWLSEELGTNYAFLAPMLLVCLANLLVFVIVLVKLTQRDAVRCPKPDLLPYLRRQVKLSVTLAGLLGLTWLLGLLFYFAQTHLFVALHYAFTLLNGLQGCFIFFTQIFAHDRIRDGWEKCLLQSRCTPQCLRAWLQNRRHARMSGTGSSGQSKNANNANRKAKVNSAGNAKSSSGNSGGSIPSLINLLRRLSLRRRNNNSSGTTHVSELSPMCKNSAAGSGGGRRLGQSEDESQPFLSNTRDESGSPGRSHRQAPLVTEENFTSTCPPRESGFFESQLAADDQSLFDITHSLAEPALAPPPTPAESLPENC